MIITWDVFGHSLGGAHTRMVVALLRRIKPNDNIIFKTFGAPRCGDLTFECNVSRRLDSDYANDGDPVVAIPRIIRPLFAYEDFFRVRINRSMQPGDSWPGKPSWITPHWSKLYERGALPEDQWRIQNINDVYTISASLPIEAQNAAAKVLGWDGFAHIDTRGLAVLPGKLGVRFTWKVEKQSDGSIKVIVCFPGTETPEELFWEDFDSRMIQTPVGGVHEGFWRGIPETVDFLTGIAAEAAKEKG